MQFCGLEKPLASKSVNTVAFLSSSAVRTASISMFVKPAPWKILSPRTRHAASSPIKSAPIVNACARPSGDGYSAYSNFTPKSLPSPSSLGDSAFSLVNMPNTDECVIAWCASLDLLGSDSGQHFHIVVVDNRRLWETASSYLSCRVPIGDTIYLE